MLNKLSARKILKRCVKITLVFLGLCLAAIFIASVTLNTEKGRLWTIELVTNYINTNTDIQVELHQLKFPTLGRLKSDFILISKNGQRLLEIKQFDLNWQPFSLLESKVVIHNISASHILLSKVLSKNTNTENSDPVNLSEFNTPQIILKRININEMAIVGFAPSEYDGIPISISGNARKTNEQPLTGSFQIIVKREQSTHVTLNLSSHGAGQATIQGQIKEADGGILSALLRIPKNESIDSSFEISLNKLNLYLEAKINKLTLPLREHDISLQGDIHLSNDLKNIKTNKLLLQIDDSAHTIEGGLTGNGINLTLKLNTLPLDLAGIWVTDIDNGWLSSNLHISGSTSAPIAAGSISASSTYRGIPMSANFTGSADKNSLLITELTLNIAKAKISSTGYLDFIAGQSKINADLNNLNLQTLKILEPRIPSELALTIHDATATLTGSLTNPSGTLNATASGSYKKKDFSIIADVRKDKSLLHFDTLKATHSKSEAHVNGQVDLETLESNLEIRASDIPTDILEIAIPHPPSDLQGSANITLSVSGSVKNPSIKGESTLIGLYQSIPFTIHTKGNYSKQRIELIDLRANTFNEQVIEANGYYQDGEFNFHSSIHQPPDQLLSAFGFKTAVGEFNSIIEANGTMSAPNLTASLHYKSYIDGYNESGDLEKTPLTWGLDIITKNQDLIITSLISRSNNDPTRFELNIPIQPYIAFLNSEKSDTKTTALPLNVSLSGSLDLQNFSFLIDPELHRLDGGFSTQLQISGTLQQPSFNGHISLERVRYENPISGTLVEKLNCQLDAQEGSLTFEKCSATDGGGGLFEILGAVNLPKRNNAGDVNLSLLVKQAHIIRRSDIENETTGSISLTGNFNSMMATGELEVTPLSATFESSYSSGIPSITVEEISTLENDGTTAKHTRSVIPKVALDLSIIAKQQAYLRGRGLEVELEGKIDIDGTLKKPLYNGEFKTVRGTFEVFNKKFNIDRGQIYLTNNAVNISILGVYKKSGQTIQVDLSGTSEKLDIRFSAIPEMPEDEILAFLIFGKSIHNMTAFEAIQLANSIQTLRGGSGGFDPIASTRKMLGVDTLSIESATTENGDSGVNVGVGKYLSDKVYLELQRTPDPSQPWKGNLEIELSPTIHLNSSTGGSTGLQDAEITWEKDY